MNWWSRAGRLRVFASRDDGQDLVEYALLVVLVSLAIVGGVRAFSTVVQTRVWDVIADLV